jgi:hypothetical protein
MSESLRRSFSAVAMTAARRKGGSRSVKKSDFIGLWSRATCPGGAPVLQGARPDQEARDLGEPLVAHLGTDGTDGATLGEQGIGDVSTTP